MDSIEIYLQKILKLLFRFLFIVFCSEVDHGRILKYLQSRSLTKDAGWVFVGYNLLLENSKHLDKR